MKGLRATFYQMFWKYQYKLHPNDDKLEALFMCSMMRSFTVERRDLNSNLNFGIVALT